jgi:chorismate mutase
MSEDFLTVKREAIADIDEEIFGLLQKRTDLAQAIGEYKAEHGMEVHNPAQEARVIERYRKLAEAHGIDADRAEEIARIVIQIAIDRENSVQKG